MPFGPNILIDEGDGILISPPPATKTPPPVATSAPPAPPPTTTQPMQPGTIPQPGRPLIDVGNGTILPAPQASPVQLPPTQAGPTPPPTLTGDPVQQGPYGPVRSGRGKRQLAADIGPGTDQIPSIDFSPYADALKNALDPTDILGDKLFPGQQEVGEAYAERRWKDYLTKHWNSPVQPTRGQGIEFYNLWEHLVEAHVENKEAVMLRRGWAIEKDIDATPPGPTRDRLLGAVAALSLVLTVEANPLLWAPTYLRYGGKGNL